MIRNPINFLKKIILKRKTNKVLVELINSGNKELKLVAESFFSVIKGNYDNNEKEWFKKIEYLRQELLSDKQLVKVKNYGAGSSGAVKTKKEEDYENTVSSFCRIASTPENYARLYHKIIRNFKSKSGVELGTCLGISASYQSSAMNINGAGNFLTCEGAPALAEISKNNFNKLNLTNCDVVTGQFSSTLDQVLNKMNPIDYAFIDGHHDEKATVEYFEKFIPFLSEHAVVVFDDIHWSDGMTHAWNKIKENPNSSFTIETQKIGIICFSKKAVLDKKHFKIYLF